MDEPAVYYSPRAWVDDREAYTSAEWRYAELWPPPEARPQRLYLRGDRRPFRIEEPRSF
jgi:hypothetical protein